MIEEEIVEREKEQLFWNFIFEPDDDKAEEMSYNLMCNLLKQKGDIKSWDKM